MKKSLLTLTALLLASSVFAQPVQSLRGGSVDDPDLPPGNFQPLKDGEPLPRDFVQQPPLIPHKIDGYEVSINFNKCLDCHGWDRAQQMRAPRISITHFRDREGTELSNIAATRYFCNQCHVPQTNARPLVENTFTPVQGRRQ
ncbi:nitrate reductase cytochrome c-type subunit [Hydrogenophilus islandicus]